MRFFLIQALLLLSLCAAPHLHARSVQASSNMMTRYTDRTLDFTSDTTTSVRDMKVVMEARDDAASFVATEGVVRGARLEAALVALREQFPQTRAASDLALAEAILSL